MKNIITLFLICFANCTFAQIFTDTVFQRNIKTVKFFQENNQESLPIIKLNSSDKLELHFDDLDGYPKNYYYSFVLCNADWTMADVSPFDYINGFQQQRFTQYRISSVTTSKYVHYQVVLPEYNCVPVKNGNYILKVYLNGNESNIVFTKRMFVTNNSVIISARVTQPFNNQLYYTHQKIQLTINANSLNILNPEQQIKTVILQNNRWDNARINIKPSFIRTDVIEYTDEEDLLFPAGKEYRWADLRSFRYATDRVDSIDKSVQPVAVFLKPETTRTQQRYLFMNDINGFYEISTTESINPWWQSDYANVYFTFIPPNHQPFENRDVYIIGELTGNRISEEGKMNFNSDKGFYEKKLFLKLGYYNYTYATKETSNKKNVADITLTDGNNWETENAYTILVYYRSLSSRYDELAGVTTIYSKNLR